VKTDVLFHDLLLSIIRLGISGHNGKKTEWLMYNIRICQEISKHITIKLLYVQARYWGRKDELFRSALFVSARPDMKLTDEMRAQ